MNTFAKIILGAAAIASAAPCFADDTDNSGKRLSFLLTGASFAIPENGWFEMACEDMGAEAINKAVSGEAIYHTARRMHAGTFYTTEELDRTDVLVLGHVHWEDYTSIATTTDYAVTYDYVIKRYIADCRALKDNPDSRYYGTPDGKPARIMFCTHWHDSRTTYNPAVRKLAERWGFPLVKFDENIGFSRLDAAAGETQPSIAYAHDSETIGGVKYGWHPLRGSNSYIQRRMAQIFVAAAADYLGLDIPFDYTLAPCSPLVCTGETARMMLTFRGGHYPFAMENDEVTASPYFMEIPDVQSDTEFTVAGITDKDGTAAASGSTSASILVADETIPCIYDSFVHQAEQSKGHADAQTLDLKNGDGWSRRIYITFPIEDVPAYAERVGVRLYFESVVPGKLGSENRPLDGIELLELGGNTSTYSANLTWDNHHSHVFEPVATTILTQNMLDSYVGWDVTDFVRAKAAEGATKVTFRVTTPYQWRALSRFTSSESTANPGKGPQMLVALRRDTSGTSPAASLTSLTLSVSGDTLLNPALGTVSIFSAQGATLLRTSAASIDLSALPAGLYIAAAEGASVKFIR